MEGMKSVVRGSSFVVGRSSFAVRRSSFAVRRSSFAVRRCSEKLGFRSPPLKGHLNSEKVRRR
jgi:hypothetical protein